MTTTNNDLCSLNPEKDWLDNVCEQATDGVCPSDPDFLPSTLSASSADKSFLIPEKQPIAHLKEERPNAAGQVKVYKDPKTKGAHRSFRTNKGTPSGPSLDKMCNNMEHMVCGADMEASSDNSLSNSIDGQRKSRRRGGSSRDLEAQTKVRKSEEDKTVCSSSSDENSNNVVSRWYQKKNCQRLMMAFLWLLAVAVVAVLLVKFLI